MAERTGAVEDLGVSGFLDDSEIKTVLQSVFVKLLWIMVKTMEKLRGQVEKVREER